MKKTTMAEIARAVQGQLLQGDDQIIIRKVSTDTRKLPPGALFIALKGERFDGHHYALQAVQAGAGGLVVSNPISDVPAHIPVIMVTDTLIALQRLASYHRQQYNIPVIGVTGSNGKTTTKDLIAAVLGTRFKVLKTQGNFNNEIGLPLTLLELDDHEVAVVEMGMRGLGQIDALGKIAGITAAVITTIGESHLELLGSKENVAQAKGEILDHVPAEGFALIPCNNPLATAQAPRCPGKVFSFGIMCAGDYGATNICTLDGGSRFTALTPQGQWEIKLNIPGRHNISNALAAVAVGLNFGLTAQEIATGLKKAPVSTMRLQVINTGEITIINDAYNANPESTQAALNTLADLAQGRRQVAVLGNMFELGAQEQQGHYQTGVAAVNVQLLVAVGDLAQQIAKGAADAGLAAKKIKWYAEKQEAISYLKQNLRAGDILLVKGSRGMAMEEIVTALQ